MVILENIDLRLYSTMRLGGKARYLAEAKTKGDIAELAQWAKSRSVPIITVGEGSNIVWRDEGFSGLVIVNRIVGKEIISENNSRVTVKLGAGEHWDGVVEWSAKKKLSGIEFLSLIPGYVGAAPVQNIGAYGAEIADTLIEVEAYDTLEEKYTKLKAADCYFGYRTSRFKKTDHGRFIITEISLSLSKEPPKPPFYDSLRSYLEENGIKEYTPAKIRKAVIAIRNTKLPDPYKVANNGSFFTNPIISKSHYAKLKKQFPGIKAWPLPDGKYKIAAGWLLEIAGFNNASDKQTGMATWPANALVLVNENAKQTQDLLDFKHKIVSRVRDLFGIDLAQEPELLP